MYSKKFLTITQLNIVDPGVEITKNPLVSPLGQFSVL